jgi:hypothetical protein
VSNDVSSPPLQRGNIMGGAHKKVFFNCLWPSWSCKTVEFRIPPGAPGKHSQLQNAWSTTQGADDPGDVPDYEHIGSF